VSERLGRALADTGARTLVVEGDLRRPAFGSRFGIDERGGLSLFLAGHAAQPTIHVTDHEALFVVGAGPTAPNPVALLNSDRMTNFLKEMSKAFSFVIVDTPPVLPVADARLLGARADGVLLVVRSGRTSSGMMKRTTSVLETSGATILGAVLNGIDSNGLDSTYYDYYASGPKHDVA